MKKAGADITSYIKRGDCFDLMAEIPDGAVDLILTDPPYGMLNNKDPNKAFCPNIGWDVALPADRIMQEAGRILRPNGRLVLFTQEPYTAQLVSSVQNNIEFTQKAYWVKQQPANVLLAKYALASKVEEIAIFRRKYSPDTSGHPLVEYFQSELARSGLKVKDINKAIGTKSLAGHFFTNGVQFRVPTRAQYEAMQQTGYFSKPWEEVHKINREYLAGVKELQERLYPSVFNLWDGRPMKTNIFEYSKAGLKLHPTQKPVKLLADLIKTYTNEGDLVLDFTAGSGSTGAACMETGRRFICFERDAHYFSIMQERLAAGIGAEPHKIAPETRAEVTTIKNPQNSSAGRYGENISIFEILKEMEA